MGGIAASGGHNGGFSHQPPIVKSAFHTPGSGVRTDRGEYSRTTGTAFRGPVGVPPP